MANKTIILVSNSLRVIATMSLITSLIWTVMSVYTALQEPAELKLSAELLAPVDPKIDEETLEALSRKRQLTDDPTIEAQLLQIVRNNESERESEDTTVNLITTSTASPAASLTPEESQL